MGKDDYKWNEPDTEELRQVQRLENDEWQDIRLKDAKIGDIIRFIEPNGEIVKNDYDEEEWRVKEEPFIDNKTGRWTALCESLKKVPNIEDLNTETLSTSREEPDIELL